MKTGQVEKNKSASKHKKNIRRFHFQSVTGETVHIHSGGPCVFLRRSATPPFLPNVRVLFFLLFFFFLYSPVGSKRQHRPLGGLNRCPLLKQKRHFLVNKYGGAAPWEGPLSFHLFYSTPVAVIWDRSHSWTVRWWPSTCWPWPGSCGGGTCVP